MASEGSFGFKATPNAKGIKLVLNVGIFFEFVPFNAQNFDENGDLLPNAQTLMIHQVEPKTDYGILLSTCSGAWRYLIGDVVQFTNVPNAEIIISGRTKQYLSLCGEHLSVDNMNHAILHINQTQNITIKEYTVCGKPHNGLFAHHWYLGVHGNITQHNIAQITNILDQKLCQLNDDYAVERTSALKEIFVHLIPNETFLEFLKTQGKQGAMVKFPRVIKGELLTNWENFVSPE
jgi:hypothetical protein